MRFRLAFFWRFLLRFFWWFLLLVFPVFFAWVLPCLLLGFSGCVTLGFSGGFCLGVCLVGPQLVPGLGMDLGLGLPRSRGLQGPSRGPSGPRGRGTENPLQNWIKKNKYAEPWVLCRTYKKHKVSEPSPGIFCLIRIFSARRTCFFDPNTFCFDPSAIKGLSVPL